MIVDKNKFKESYNELYSSGNNIFPDSIFTFTTNFTSTHFESILQVNDSRLHNISFLSNKSEKIKLLSIGKIKNYTIEDFSKACIPFIRFN